MQSLDCSFELSRLQRVLLARPDLTRLKYGSALALWAAFQMLEQVFLAYTPAGVPRVIFGNLILTVLLLQLIPARLKEAD